MKALAALSFLLLSASAEAQLSVRYRTENTIYIGAGTASGVAVGDRFEVMRGGNVIATIEIQFAAEQSASGRILSETTPVQAGDAVRRIGQPLAQPDTPAPVAMPGLGASATQRFSGMSLSGSVSVDSETSGEGEGRFLGRVSARARNVAGLPLTLRTRLRVANEAGAERHRLYELSLLYEPFDGRVAIQAGRIGNTPAVGLGYLDGALASVRVFESLSVGAFYGFRPDVTDLSPDTSTTKLGAFLKLTPAPMAEVTIAGVQASRDDEESSFVAVDGRYSPSDRLSFFAHGRASVAGEEEEEQDVDTILTAIARVSESTTVTASYERISPGIDDDLRTADEVIDDALRQGFRVTLRNPYFFIGGGVRSGETGTVTGSDEQTDTTYSASAGLSHPSLAFGIRSSISATGFTSDHSDGLFASARFARRFGAGHLAELHAGALVVDEMALEDMTVTTWVRIGGWIELPHDVFARAELELVGGDTPTGHRLNLGLGYRF